MIESYESLLLELTTGSNGRRSKFYARGRNGALDNGSGS
jgi:hypothetical protein